MSISPSSLPTPVKWLLFLGAVIIVGGILLVLPHELTQLIFRIAIVLVALYVVPSLQPTVAGWILQLRKISKEHSLFFPRVAFVISGLILISAGYFLQPQYKESLLGVGLFLLCLPVIRIALPAIQLSQPIDDTSEKSVDAIRVRWRWMLPTILFTILLTLINAPFGDIHRRFNLGWALELSPHWQMAILIGLYVSVAKCFVGRVIPDFRQFHWKPHYRWLALIVIVATALRLWQLETVIHSFIDELNFLDMLVRFNWEKPPPMLVTLGGTKEFTWVYPYFQRWSVNLLGPSLTSLRMVSVIVGVWTILATYGLAVNLFNRRIAMMSAMLLATLPLHIHFSRVGITNIVDPFWGVTGFAFLVRAVKQKRPTDFAIAGVMLGLSHYYYEGGRLFFTLFAFCWLVWVYIWRKPRPALSSGNLKRVGVLAISAILTSAPIYLTILSNARSLTRRLDDVKFGGGGFSLTGFGLTWITYHFFIFNPVQLSTILQRYVQFRAYGRFFPSEYSFVMPVLVPVFLLGCAYLIWRLRSVEGSMLIWWLVGVVISNGLISDELSSITPRYLVVLPALVIIISLGIYLAWETLTSLISARQKRTTHVSGRWSTIGLVGITLMISAYFVDYYFNTLVPDFNDERQNVAGVGGYRPDQDDAIFRAVELPLNTDIHVISKVLVSNTLTKSVPEFYDRYDLDAEYVHVRDFTHEYLRNLDPNRNQAFFIEAINLPLLKHINQYYELRGPYRSPFEVRDLAEFLLYFAPAEARREQRPKRHVLHTPF